MSTHIMLVKTGDTIHKPLESLRHGFKMVVAFPAGTGAGLTDNFRVA